MGALRWRFSISHAAGYTHPCIIGRAADCHPQLPDDEAHSTISRYPSCLHSRTSN